MTRPRWLTSVWLVSVLLAAAATVLTATAFEKVQILNQIDMAAISQINGRMASLTTEDRLLLIDAGDRGEHGPSSALLPLDRTVYGELFVGLSRAKAKVVFTDVMFVDDMPTSDPEFGKQLDQALAGRETRYIFPAYPEEIGADDREPDGLSHAFLIAQVVSDRRQRVDVGHALPIRTGLEVTGGIARKRDRDTQEMLWNCALLAAWRMLDLDPAQATTDGTMLRIGAWESSLGGNDDFTFQWTDEKEGFRTLSLAEAMKSVREGDGQMFAGKLVVIANLQSKQDLVDTPQHHGVSGGLVMANLINTALSPKSLRTGWLGRETEVGYVFAISLLSAVAVGTRRRGWMLAGMLLPFVWSIAVPLWAASSLRLVLPSVWPFASSMAAALLSLWLLARTTGLEDTRREGEIMDATVLFADLEDSTGQVGQLGAAGYQQQYGAWVKQCEAIVRRHGGQLERTTGDGFLAVFPGQGTLGCLRAVRQMQDLEGPVATFGFESGPVSGGYVTEAGRKVWSSSGTTVNMARRLQSQAGVEGESLIFGPIAARYLAESHAVERLGVRDLKGIANPVECFTLREPKPSS